jgi:hypothetical protein
MRNDKRALVAFFLIACIPPWIGWSLLTFGVVPTRGVWQTLFWRGRTRMARTPPASTNAVIFGLALTTALDVA